jgi:hypothetical protein
MPRGNDFTAIDPTEVINGTWDFGPWLSVSSTISSISTTSCTVLSGTDQSAATRLIGVPQILASPSTKLASQAVIQQWGNMVAGVLYVMLCTIRTSDNQTLTLYAHQLCQGTN